MERWSSLPSQSGVYFMRLDRQLDNNNAEESTITIWLSDFKALWNETVTRQVLIKRFSEKNPTLDRNDDVIHTELIAALGSVASIKDLNIRNEADNDDSIEVQLKYLIFDATTEVKFQWLLKKCEPHKFFDQITKPLLRQIRELHDHKAKLIDIANRKDGEIGEYKLVSGQVEIRKRFVTEKFDEQSFESECQMFNGDIDQFDSLIGPSAKNIISDESGNATEQSIQNTTAVKHKSPSGNHRPPTKVHRAGQYEFINDDDEDDSD